MTVHDDLTTHDAAALLQRFGVVPVVQIDDFHLENDRLVLELEQEAVGPVDLDIKLVRQRLGVAALDDRGELVRRYALHGLLDHRRVLEPCAFHGLQEQVAVRVRVAVLFDQHSDRRGKLGAKPFGHGLAARETSVLDLR